MELQVKRKLLMNSNLKQINKAGLVKRILALVMDAAVAGFVMLGFVALATQPIANKAFNYEANIVEVDEAKAFSKLYVLEAKDIETKEGRVLNNSDEIEGVSKNEQIVMTPLRDSKLGIDEVKNRLQYYYCVYRTNDTEKLDFRTGMYAPLTIVNYEGKEYTNEEFFDTVIAPVDNVETLKSKFVANAELELSETDRIVSLINKIDGAKYFIYGIPFVISFAIFFIAIPLIFSGGETLGQKVLHIAYVNSDGYTIKKRQIVFKQLLLLLYVSTPLLIGGNILTRLAFLGLFLLAHFIVSFVDKKGRSPVDFAAYTMSVDTLTSVWFDDVEDEQKFNERVDQNVKKAKSVKVENKNIIQVGSKVIKEKK